MKIFSKVNLLLLIVNVGFCCSAMDRQAIDETFAQLDREYNEKMQESAANLNATLKQLNSEHDEKMKKVGDDCDTAMRAHDARVEQLMAITTNPKASLEQIKKAMADLKSAGK